MILNAVWQLMLRWSRRWKLERSGAHCGCGAPAACGASCALCARFQLVELLLMEYIYYFLHGQDGVEAVAVPLQSTPVKVLAVLHGYEVLVQEDADGVYHSVSGHPGDSGDGVVAGMAGVCPAVLNQEQVGVHHEGRERKIQQEDFVGEGKKLPAFRRQKIGGERALPRDQSCIRQGRQVLSHSTLRLVNPLAITSGESVLAPLWEE